MCIHEQRLEEGRRNIQTLNAYMWIEFLLKDKDTFRENTGDKLYSF